MMDGNRFARLFLLTIPWVMALSSVAGPSLGSIRHTGLYWMASFVIAVLLIPFKRGRIAFPVWAWLPFFLYMAATLTWTRLDLRDNIQFYIQLLVFPLIGCIASYTVTSLRDMDLFRVHYVAATVLIGLFCCYYVVGPGQADQYATGSLYNGFAERPAAASLIVSAAFFIANAKRQLALSFVLWSLCFAISLLSGSRMATFILLSLWIVHPNFASLTARFASTAAIGFIGLAAFYTPIIQDRFFNRQYGFSGQGTIGDVLQGKFDSAGRFDSWPLIFQRAFDAGWFGHGLGESATFVFRIWAPMDKPHNEYLRIFYEGGVVGLTAFLFGLIGTLIHLSLILYRTKRWNWPASAAFMAWIGFLLLAIVDNPLVYGNNFVHVVFFLVGAASGIAAKSRERNQTLGEENLLDPRDEDLQHGNRSEEPSVSECLQKIDAEELVPSELSTDAKQPFRIMLR